MGVRTNTHIRDLMHYDLTRSEQDCGLQPTQLQNPLKSSFRLSRLV